jgi:hypothetical protein
VQFAIWVKVPYFKKDTHIIKSYKVKKPIPFVEQTKKRAAVN